MSRAPVAGSVPAADRGGPTAGRTLRSRGAVTALLAVAAAYMVYTARKDGLSLAASGSGLGYDFHGTIWLPDRAVLHGLSPYPAGSDHFVGAPAVYLPPIFLATLPLGWLSFSVAAWVWLAILLAAGIGVLAVLGVRDPWWYVFFMASLPVEQSLVLGNATILVVLGAALAWRFRRRPAVAPLAVAATVAVKFWAWPLLVWLLFVRVGSAVRAAIALAVVTLVAWALIDFRGLGGYPGLMHAEAHAYAARGMLLAGGLLALGVPLSLTTAAGLALGLIFLILAWLGQADEVECFSLVLLACLVATPVFWPHYLALLAVPLVLLRPWFPLALWWFPALWLFVQPAYNLHGTSGERTVLCLFAALPFVVLAATRSRRLADS